MSFSGTPGARTTAPHPTAVIHDIRYSRFEGQLRSRPASVVALARSSATRALGIRKSAGSKVWPFLLLAAAWFPAAVAVGVPLFIDAVDTPLDVIGYYDLLNTVSIIVLAYGATTVPSLLTRERRDRVLSLYFATALSPWEYLLGKILAAVALLALVVLGPMLLLLVGGVFVAQDPLQFARDNVDDLPRVAGAAVILVIYQALVGLAIGSLTSRRVFAVGGYLALMLVTPALAGTLASVSGDDGWFALDLLSVPVYLGGRVLREQIGVDVAGAALWTTWTVVVVVCIGVLIQRYRSGRDA